MFEIVGIEIFARDYGADGLGQAVLLAVRVDGWRCGQALGDCCEDGVLVVLGQEVVLG